MLFNTEKAGFRLERFEFYNWGSFDNKIWSITPNGDSSLLTGANGSGKTTVVDAMVTLLVPPAKRHYNQSSGADKKRERTEESYVLGAIGSRRSEDSSVSISDYLRSKKDYSVLIGTFKNETLEQEFTLGQLRWYTSSGFRRLYFSSNRPLSLKNDLLPINFQSDYRTKWKNNYKIIFYDSFSLYSKYFIPVLGLRSEKGLNLFSHIVGVKVLGNLNEFIRSNMLDTPDMESAFTRLFTNYQHLFQAHQRIELADKQLQYLTPVMKCIQDYEKFKKNVEQIQTVKEILPGYFASRIKIQLSKELNIKNDEMLQAEEKSRHLEDEQISTDRKRRDLQSAIDQNSAAQRINSLETEINHLTEKKKENKNSIPIIPI